MTLSLERLFRGGTTKQALSREIISMPNILPESKQIDILRLMSEGASLSSTARLTKCHRDTCNRLMVRFGEGCKKLLEWTMQDLQLRHIELDEIWTFCRKKDANVKPDDPADEVGSIFLYVALDQDTRLVPTFHVGKRDGKNTHAFISSLYRTLKVPGPGAGDDHHYQKGKVEPLVRISTDGFGSYEEAIHAVFGPYAKYGKVIKNTSKKRTKKIANDPNFIKRISIRGDIPLKDISTSLVERHNLTTRTFMARFRRRTMSYSKKLDNLRAAVAIYLAHYNFCWKQRIIKTTPAVAADIATGPFSFYELYRQIREMWPELFLDNDSRNAA